jgi:hypothetical protein
VIRISSKAVSESLRVGKRAHEAEWSKLKAQS